MPQPSPFIVAEMSANHLGSRARAMEIIAAASWAGADAVKFQTWSPGTMCVDETYRLAGGPWNGRRLSDLYAEAWTPWEWHKPMFDWVRSAGMIPFSAAFDRESVDFLESLNVDRHKVASFELTDLPLIRYMASKGKPMILSTGMATRDEIAAAIDAADRAPDTLVLKCTSAYPADASDANLDTHTGWGCGLSDHSQGIGVAVAAAALGYTYIEKHLTLSRADGGPDAGFSMEPAEFKQMVTECRRAAAAIGVPSYGPGPQESTALRRSLWVVRDMEQGELFVFGENVRTARPALGDAPSMETVYRNRVAKRSIKAGTPLTWSLVG